MISLVALTVLGSRYSLPNIPSYPGYQLVWSDEFNRKGAPDPKNWVYEEGFVRNEEYQLYRRENVRCEKGKLIIEGRRETLPNPAYRADAAVSDWRFSRKNAEYTAGCIKTEGKQAWQFGRFEMRGRIDIRSGLWPAFWTLGSARDWPSGGEIDIMEFYRGNLLANVAWGTAKQWSGEWDTAMVPIGDVAKAAGYASAEDWSKAFHTWRMDWDEDFIRLYVDGNLMNERDLRTTINGSEDRANPFREPHYLLLNLAIGGANGGDPTQTPFPTRFEVDWVRVYQRATK